MIKTLDSHGMPASVDVERLVLGCAILYADLFHEVRPVLTEDDFSLERHKRIWRCATALYDAGSHVDYITLLKALEAAGGQEDDTLPYLAGLDNGLPQFPSIASYARLLRDDSARRRIIHIATNLIQRAAAREPAQELMDSMGRMALDMTAKDGAHGLVSAAELVECVGLSQLLTPRKDLGLMGPWEWMNRSTCGFLPGELWILAAHTSMGKTSAALQFATHVARRKTGAALFSLEMGRESLFSRACYQVARVDSESGKAGRLNTDERRKVAMAAEEVRTLPLYFDDSTASTVLAIHAAVRRRKLKANIGLIVVDYLQLLGDGGRHETRAQAVGANARALKLMASEFACPVLLLSQFNRESAKGKEGQPPRRPELYDLKESGDIENHASGVWFIHRASVEDVEIATAEFILAKQREGRRNIMQEFYFFSRFQRFDGKEDRYENE